MSHRATLFKHQFVVTAVTDSDDSEFVRGQLNAVCTTIVGGARAATLYGNGIVSVHVEPVLWTPARKCLAAFGIFGGLGIIVATFIVLKLQGRL